MAGPFEVMTVDFATDLAGRFDDGLNVTATLPVGRAGEVHAVAAWFDAWIGRDPAGRPVRLSTGPEAADGGFARQQHWGQLVQVLPLAPSPHANDPAAAAPLRVAPGQALEVTAVVAARGGGGSIYFPLVRAVPAA